MNDPHSNNSHDRKLIEKEERKGRRMDECGAAPENKLFAVAFSESLREHGGWKKVLVRNWTSRTLRGMTLGT